MARVVASLGRSRARRRLALCIAQLFVVALIVTSSISDAGAESTYPVGQTSQQFFVTNCRGNGGTTKRLESRVVECTLPNDYKIVCNWKSGLCKDFPPAAISTTGGSNTGIPNTGIGSRSVMFPRSTVRYSPIQLMTSSSDSALLGSR